MNFEIRNYQQTDFEAIKEITQRSFKLASYAVDYRFSADCQKKIAWELWAKPALLKNNPACIVATVDNEISGFLIWGAHSNYSEALGMKIGSIILIATKPGFNLGTKLIGELIERFKNLNIKLITVGTDSDNLSALGIYEKFGFRTILNWATFRYYSDDIEKNYFPENKQIEISEYNGEDIEHLLEFLGRPNSFLVDKRLPDAGVSKILSLSKSDIKNSINSGKLKTFIAKQNNKILAFLTIEYEKFISDLVSRDIYRINDLSVQPDNRNQNIGYTMLKRAKEYIRSISKNFVIEIFCALNNYNMLRLLTKNNFYLAHCAVNLHKII